MYLLIGQEAGGLDDDFAQLVDIALGQRLALGAGQTQFAPGRAEGRVDGLVRDASLVGHVFQTARVWGSRPENRKLKKKRKKIYPESISQCHVDI